MGIGDHLSRDRADEPALEQGVTAMTDHDVIDVIALCIPDNLLGRMPDHHLEVRLEGLLCEAA